jgi:hypothetical protein
MEINSWKNMAKLFMEKEDFGKKMEVGGHLACKRD